MTTPAEIDALLARTAANTNAIPWLRELHDAIRTLYARAIKAEAALRELIQLNDSHSPFGGEIARDRIDRAWDAARAAAQASAMKEGA